MPAIKVCNVTNYKINVKGVVNTYPAKMKKQYIEHKQNVTSKVVDACNYVTSKNQNDLKRPKTLLRLRLFSHKYQNTVLTKS